MTHVPIFKGKAKPDGTIIFHDNTAFRRHVKTLATLDAVEVIVRKPEHKRTLRSNSYYHGVVVKTIADELGYEPEEMHEALAWKFLREGDHDDPLPRRKSTRDMSQEEFEDYVSRVKRFAATELDIVVPEPGEVMFK